LQNVKSGQNRKKNVLGLSSPLRKLLDVFIHVTFLTFFFTLFTGFINKKRCKTRNTEYRGCKTRNTEYRLQQEVLLEDSSATIFIVIDFDW